MIAHFGRRVAGNADFGVLDGETNKGLSFILGFLTVMTPFSVNLSALPITKGTPNQTKTMQEWFHSIHDFLVKIPLNGINLEIFITKLKNA